METIHKKDIGSRIAKHFGITANEAQDIIQAFLDNIIDELSKGNRLEMRGFAVFEPTIRKGRLARNPRTGEPVEVPPKGSVRFKAGKEMKEAVLKLEEALEEEGEEQTEQEQTEQAQGEQESQG